jgi:hypothetical protein
LDTWQSRFFILHTGAARERNCLTSLLLAINLHFIQYHILHTSIPFSPLLPIFPIMHTTSNMAHTEVPAVGSLCDQAGVKVQWVALLSIAFPFLYHGKFFCFIHFSEQSKSFVSWGCAQVISNKINNTTITK